MMKSPRTFIKRLSSILVVLAFLYILLVSVAFSEVNGTNTTSNDTNITLNITIDLDSDGYNDTIDCNDMNSSVWQNLTLYADYDNDTYTLGQNITFCTNGTLPSGYVPTQKNEDCNDSTYLINPGMNETLYNNIDDDCNASTNDYLIFNITTSKDTYNIGEQAGFTVNSENRSSVNITLKVPNNYYNYQAQFVNQTYPINDFLPQTKKAGEYIIIGKMSHKGQVLYYNKTINITNSIAISVSGNTVINQNETLSLQATASGGYGTNYNYSWYFGDGTASVKGRNATHVYATPGDYTVIVTAIDYEGNQKDQSFTVSVNRLYSLRIISLDESTSGVVSGVNIVMGSKSLVTGIDGSATFINKKGRYDITAYKSGYNIYESRDYYLQENSTLTIKLSQIDVNAPAITLRNKSIEINSDNVEISFSVQDTSKTTCSIYTSADSNWWNLEGDVKNITSTIDQRFLISNLSGQSTRYRVECVDYEQNTGLSEEGVISISEFLLDIETVSEVEDLRQKFSSAKTTLENLGVKEKEIYLILDIDTEIKNAERLSTSYERDLNTIQNPRCPGLHCNLTSEERQRRIDELTNKVISAMQKVPMNIEVTSSDEFVKYPTKYDLEDGIKKYYESKNKVLTKSQLNSLVEKGFLLQSKLTVSTKILHARIEYIDGEFKTITLVKKKLDLYGINATTANNPFLMVEDFTQESLQASKPTFITKASQLSRNNLFEISLSEKSLTYYLDKEVSSENLKMANTLLIPSTMQKTNALSGLAIFDSISLKDINYLYLIIALFILIIILRLLILFGLFDLIKQKLGFEEREYHTMMMLINDSRDYLDAGDLEKSALIYKEIKLKYESVSLNNRVRTYDSIFELCSKLDEEYMKKLVKIASDDLKLKNRRHAVDVYAVMQNTYKRLKEASKALFENDVKEIHSKLSSDE